MPATLFDIQKKYGEQVTLLYKDSGNEPYMESENGIGYQGTVVYDQLQDKILCNECGKWYETLSSHLPRIHKTDQKNYRDKYGINYNIGICSKRLSRKFSETAINNIKTNKNFASHNGLNQGTHSQRKTFTTQYKNRFALCDAQTAVRLAVIREQSGEKEITSKSVKKYDIRLYDHLRRRYGTIVAGCKALGIEAIGKGYKGFDDIKVIARLRAWVTAHGRIPNYWERRNTGGVPISAVYRHFGSWRKAQAMAGLDQLLEDLNRKELILTTQPARVVNE